MNRFIKLALCIAPLLLSACATDIKATSAQNPPPAEAFSAFGRIQLKPTTFKPGFGGDQDGLRRIDANIQLELNPALTEWNARPDNGRTLIIEPVVDVLDYKAGAQRVVFGPMAGSSGVLIYLNIHDQNGRAIDKPEFFQGANAAAAGFTFGAHDMLMLTRVGQMSADYVKANFDAPVGGPTSVMQRPARTSL